MSAWSRAGWLWTKVLLGLIALAPFARGLLAGDSFYFRDLGLIFFPLRKLALDSLSFGEIVQWNPYVHEGSLLPIPAVAYPLDLLQLLWPTESGLSLSLALHYPFAALSFYALARALKAPETSAAASALLYALGGFALSCLNLYIYAQALAWAPLVVLAAGRCAALRGSRSIAALAVTSAVIVSTTGAELAVQAVLLGIALGLPAPGLPSPFEAADGPAASPREWIRSAARLGSGLCLGFALVSPVIAGFRAQMEGTERGAGFATAVVLAHSIHPLSWLQTLISGIYGDPYDLVNRFWGQNFFARGFPYFVSVYLGPLALGLALAGAVGRLDLPGEPRSPLARARLRLIVALAVAVLVASGRYVGLEAIVDRLPVLHSFRYPQKAFFTAHFSIALLAAAGLSTLEAGRRRAPLAAVTLGGLLLALPVLPLALPSSSAWFVAGFFPVDMAWPERIDALSFALRDAASGGALAVAAGLAGWWLARQGRPRMAAIAVGTLLVTDLIRAGAGLNPMVTPAFFSPSPEGAALAQRLRRSGVRVFTCDLSSSPAYRSARGALKGRHEMVTFALLRESLTPNENVDARVPSGLSLDLTMMVPAARVGSPDLASCSDLEALRPRLAEAAVSRVLSVDSLAAPWLELEERIAPERLQGLKLNVYRVLPAAPPLVEVRNGRLLSLAEPHGRVEATVEARDDAMLVVRQAWVRGFRAWVDGVETPVDQYQGRHMAVRLPRGRHDVKLGYSVPGLRQSLWISALAVLACVALLLKRGDLPASPGDYSGPDSSAKPICL